VANEIQRLLITGCTTGTFKLTGDVESRELDISTINPSEIAYAVGDAFAIDPYTDVYVSPLGGDVWNIEFVGAAANTNYATLQVTSNTTDGAPGAPYITPIQNGGPDSEGSKIHFSMYGVG
jgi:hypothetical protein